MCLSPGSLAIGNARKNAGIPEDEDDPLIRCQEWPGFTPLNIKTMEKQDQNIMQQRNEVCEERRETLSTVLSYLCVFGDSDATAILNEVTLLPEKV